MNFVLNWVRHELTVTAQVVRSPTIGDVVTRRHSTRQRPFVFAAPDICAHDKDADWCSALWLVAQTLIEPVEVEPAQIDRIE
jgi:hypothetical protein